MSPVQHSRADHGGDRTLASHYSDHESGKLGTATCLLSSDTSIVKENMLLLSLLATSVNKESLPWGSQSRTAGPASRVRGEGYASCWAVQECSL